MLLYQPAFDINHTRLRMLELLELKPNHSMSVDQLRILDFYALFPHLLGTVSLLQGHTRFKNQIRTRASRYNRVPNPPELLRRMKGTQEIALRSLSAAGFLETQALDAQLATRTDKPLPDAIIQLLSSKEREDVELMTFLSQQLTNIPLQGSNGLKARTGLMEYRYDPI